MASAFAHALVAVVAGKVATARKQSFGFWLLGVFCAVIPDADVIAFKFGIPYESMWGHRGITHSLLFALLLALLLTWLFFKQRKPFSRKWWLTTIYFFVCTVSHGVLDAMTTGGKGIAFFAPFDNGRYWLPWREIQVSPVSASQFFSEWGLRVLKSEAIWVGLPCLAVLLFVLLFRRLRKG